MFCGNGRRWVSLSASKLSTNKTHDRCCTGRQDSSLLLQVHIREGMAACHARRGESFEPRRQALGRTQPGAALSALPCRLHATTAQAAGKGVAVKGRARCGAQKGVQACARACCGQARGEERIERFEDANGSCSRPPRDEQKM